jgi:hypothetical protein
MVYDPKLGSGGPARSVDGTDQLEFSTPSASRVDGETILAGSVFGVVVWCR